VKSVEILKSGAYTSIYGIDGLGGIIIINTIRGGGINPLKNIYPGILTFEPKGYQATKAFYSPKYDAPNPNNQADLRTTIYWNPFINTTTGGKTSFSFFNADSPGRYKVIVEGIDADGKLGRAVYHYTVN
jgi:outer membrane receptor protein involved in Fe transport